MRVWLAALVLGCVAQAAGAAVEPVIEAARAGDSDAVLEMIEQGASVNTAEKNGTTLLHWAVHHENVELAVRLLKSGAAADTLNRYGSSPLAEAAGLGNARLVQLLLEAGADVESANPQGQTALMLAARAGSVESVRLLIRKGAKVNATESWRGQTALMWAAARKHPEVVQLLIRHGADVNARSIINDWPRQVSSEPRAMYRLTGGLTPLLYAVREGCADCVEALLKGGAKIDLPDPDGITPLLMALGNMHFDVARLLLGRGADPNRWDWWGQTPLYMAVDMNTVPHGGRADRPSTDRTTSLDLIRMLLAAGANPNAQLKLMAPYRAPGFDRGGDVVLTTGATPLLRAAKAHDEAAVALLLKHGAKVDLPNVMGVTPLLAAAGLGSTPRDTRGDVTVPDVQQRAIRTLALLLDAGADVNAQVRDTTSRAARYGRSSVMKDREGQTALHSAAGWRWDEVTAFLVSRGARAEIKDSRGKTPLEARR